ncbi:MAG: hypothetical protein AABX98_01775 [Nanoarchaeota archaeon]
MNKIIIIIVTIFLVSIFPIYQLLALNNIQIQNFTIDNFGMNRKLLFTVEGTGELYNPGIIPVTIKEIRYIGTIKEEIVLEGTIETINIPAGETATFSLNEEIDWVPDAATVEEILAGQNVTLVIQTEADASYLYFFTVTGEKDVEISITRLLKPYVEEQVAALSEKLLSFLK